MSKPPEIYSRLTRNASGVGTYSSMWLGADHLLIVTSTGYTESYSRVMLRDIKGIFVTRTSRRFFWSLPWAISAVIGGINLLVVLLRHETPVFSALFFVLGAVGLTVNAMLGQGCCARFLTDVQMGTFPSLVRLPKTRRVIERLRPLIEAAQADLGTAAAPVPLQPPPLETPPPVPESLAGDKLPPMAP